MFRVNGNNCKWNEFDCINAIRVPSWDSLVLYCPWKLMHLPLFLQSAALWLKPLFFGLLVLYNALTEAKAIDTIVVFIVVEDVVTNLAATVIVYIVATYLTFENARQVRVKLIKQIESTESNLKVWDKRGNLIKVLLPYAHTAAFKIVSLF
uniref:Uncharacterized protein n=1 Tax=Glossina palpalis gambiensis TaxID=67801 RepID=A0A1B0BQJ6_9MUSC